MFKKIFFYTFILFVIYGCDKENETKANFSDAIIDAQVMSFEQAESTLGNEKIRDCCTYAYLNSDQGSRQQFDVKDSFFVKVRLDLDLIAYITFEYSCGTLMHEKKCSRKLLDEKIETEKSDRNYPYNLFGKYKNGWKFFTSSNEEIQVTDKFGGFSIYSVEMENNHADLILGVADNRPARIEFFTKRGGYVVSAEAKPELIKSQTGI